MGTRRVVGFDERVGDFFYERSGRRLRDPGGAAKNRNYPTHSTTCRRAMRPMDLRATGRRRLRRAGRAYASLYTNHQGLICFINYLFFLFSKKEIKKIQDDIGYCLITRSGLKEDFLAELDCPSRDKGLCGAKDKN